MRKKALAALLAAAMLAVTGCSGMPGMGTTNAPATKAGDEKAADAGSEANAGSNDTVYELKIHTSQTEQALITRNYQKLADTVNEKSDGRLSVKVFPAGQLGADEDVIEQAIQGVNVAVNTDAARMGQYVKDFSIFMMEKHGIKILSFSFYDGPRHFMTNKPINTPDDLKGQRIRTIGQEVCTESLAAMGATPISMSWGEVYNGIQSKALDGCEAQNTSTFPSKIYEVCNTQSKTGHFQLMQGLICGKKWFDSLPEDLQTLLTETAQEIGKETAADVMKEADEAEQQMKDAGLTVIEPDVQPFKDAVEPVYEKLGFAELRQQIYKEIGKTE